jgi:hypothetical protein
VASTESVPGSLWPSEFIGLGGRQVATAAFRVPSTGLYDDASAHEAAAVCAQVISIEPTVARPIIDLDLPQGEGALPTGSRSQSARFAPGLRVSGSRPVPGPLAPAGYEIRFPREIPCS